MSVKEVIAAGHKPIRTSWLGMLSRCRCEGNEDFHNYGARGISVCDSWLAFDEFRKWSLANGWQDGLSIDRIDSDGNYEPSNCRWLTKSENSRLACEGRKAKGGYKMTHDSASALKRLFIESDLQVSEIARQFSISIREAWDIVKGERWKDAEPFGDVARTKRPKCGHITKDVRFRIQVLREIGDTVKNIMDAFGVCYQTVYDIIGERPIDPEELTANRT